MSDIVVEELPIPSERSGTAWADFAQTVEVRNTVEELGYGTPDVRVTAETLLGWFQDPHSPHHLFAVRLDGRIVARGLYEHLAEGDTRACWVDARVLPAYRGRGIGTAIMDHVEARARAEGRTHAIVYIVSPEGAGPRIEPPTGSGSLPADNPEVRFLLHRGYRLEQVVRGSRLPLPLDADELDARLAAARARTGDGYTIREWTGTTPEAFRDDMAVLYTRMSTDAPQGALEEPEDIWTGDRVAEHEERTNSDGTVLLTVAVEAADGHLAGFTQLSVPPAASAPVEQRDTLVLREHRGHALGMLLKLANLAQLARTHPGHPSITTWNADENRHMLDVNEALGFVPMGYEGAWKLEL